MPRLAGATPPGPALEQIVFEMLRTSMRHSPGDMILTEFTPCCSTRHTRAASKRVAFSKAHACLAMLPGQIMAAALPRTEKYFYCLHRSRGGPSVKNSALSDLGR